jgi:hypothetical protein
MSQLRGEVVKAESRQKFAEERYAIPLCLYLSIRQTQSHSHAVPHSLHRYEQLKQNAESQTNEVKALRARNAEFSASVNAHQLVRLLLPTSFQQPVGVGFNNECVLHG